jgi:hypothetical protein
MHPELRKELEQTALKVYHLSLERVGIRCPKWAKCRWKFRKQFLRIYFRAALKNHFRHAYGKEGERYHVDHIIPLKGENVCGLHVPWNLHVIHAVVNMAKGTLIVPEWMDKGGVTTRRQHREKVESRRQERKARRRPHHEPTEQQRREDEDLMSRFDHAISF